MEDIFVKYLNKQDDPLVKQALTDKSFRNYKVDGKVNNFIEDNEELSTYGDAIIKTCMCHIILNSKCKYPLSVVKQRFESDRYFVKFVARKYNLLDYMYFDKKDQNKPKDYNYKGKKYKYIATAVEAMVAAIFTRENMNLDPIIELVRSWMHLVDDDKTEYNLIAKFVDKKAKTNKN